MSERPKDDDDGHRDSGRDADFHRQNSVISAGRQLGTQNAERAVIKKVEAAQHACCSRARVNKNTRAGKKKFETYSVAGVIAGLADKFFENQARSKQNSALKRTAWTAVSVKKNVEPEDLHEGCEVTRDDAD